MPTARTASSNATCLLPEPSWSQAVLLFLHTLQASPGKQAGRKSRGESRAGTGKVGGRREGEKGGWRGGGGGGQGDGGRAKKNTNKQQKVRASRRQRSQANQGNLSWGTELVGEQRSRKKEQEPSLAAHSEQLKTKHADRKTGKRGSNGRARRVDCKLAKGGAGGGESRAGED